MRMVHTARHGLVLLVGLAHAAGCGSSEESPAGTTTSQGGGGATIDAGAELPCPPGELELDDGSCQPPGIPSNGCGEGFEHDGEYGCEPILPAERCPPGQLAVPGDSACRPVSECGSGTWGDIPVDGTTVYVDGSYQGVSTGSASQPFTTIGEGVGAAAPGAIVAIAAGAYPESVTIAQSVVLWGVCPSQVTITASSGAAIEVASSAASVTVRDLACTGGARGVRSQGAPEVNLERLWIHDTASVGIRAVGGTEVSVVTLRDSLVEGTSFRSASVEGAALVVERSLLRSASYSNGEGAGIHGKPSGAAPAWIEVRGSVVEDSPGVGIEVSGSDLVAEDSVIRAQRPYEDQSRGVGIWSGHSDGAFASVTVRGSLVEQSTFCGICASYAELVVERTVVRDIESALDDDGGGYGIRIASFAPELAQRPQGRITQSLIERCQHSGLRVAGADAEIEGLVVRDVTSHGYDGQKGRGINVQYTGNEQRAAVAIRGCRVERTQEVGILIEGSDGLIDSCLVRDIRPRDSDGLLGVGVAYFPAADAIEERTQGTLSRSVVQHAHGAGIGVVAAKVTLVDAIVEGSLPQDTFDDFGDGIVASATTLSAPGHHPTELEIIRATVSHSARAGLAAFAVPVTVQDSWFHCNTIHLNGEALDDTPFNVADLGGNLCGCGDQSQTCQVLSSGLQPPPGL